MNSLLAASDGGAGNAIFALSVLGVATLLYWLPTILVVLRHGNIAQVAVINGFLGWTFVGWVVALALAFTRPVVVVQSYGQVPR